MSAYDAYFARKLEDIELMQSRIEAARAAGRDPRSIRRVVNAGYVDAETLVGLVLDCGMDTILVAEGADEMRQFMSEVAPRVREEVESRRSRRAD